MFFRVDLRPYVVERVKLGAIFPNFKVQVDAGDPSHTASGSLLGDSLPPVNVIASFDVKLSGVGVEGFEAIAMIDDNGVAITALPSG